MSNEERIKKGEDANTLAVPKVSNKRWEDLTNQKDPGTFETDLYQIQTDINTAETKLKNKRKLYNNAGNNVQILTNLNILFNRGIIL